jgi:peptidoglycan L-alanyl-D-glutamate endopeptidase CwlK
MKLTAKDEAHLKRVHPDLARVMRRAAADWKATDKAFFITCSIRTLAEQKKLLAAGATRTLRSRHLPGKTNKLSHAIDLAVRMGKQIKWDWPLYVDLAKRVKAAARAEKVLIEWGGDWTSFRDGPHFQLPWNKYPG